MTRRYSQAITICGVLVALSMVAVAGTAAADNASDYPPIDVNSTVEIYDGSDSLNDTIELDHARGYDDDALAVIDCSIMDCSDTTAGGNLSSAVSDHELYVESTNNATVSFTQDDIEVTTNGTNPEAVIQFRGVSPSDNATTQFIRGSAVEPAPVVDGSVSGYSSPGIGSVAILTNSSKQEYYVNGGYQTTDPLTFAPENQTGYSMRLQSSGNLSDVSFWDRRVSSDEVSLLHDEYRVGGFVPDLTETTAQTVPENGSLTWDVNSLRDAETTLKVQSYDGSEWQTEEELTVDQTAEYDIGVEGGSEYRFVSEPNSTVGSSGGYFFGGGSATVLNIFGVVIDRGMATGMAAVTVLLGILAFFYPGMRLFGKGSDQ